MNKRILIIAGAAVVIVVVVTGLLVGGAIARSWRRSHVSELIAQAQRQPPRVEGKPTPEPTPNAAGIEAMLTGESFAYRLSAARLLGGRKDIPAPERVRMLAAALSAEVESPSEGATVRDNYLQDGQVLRLVLTRSISQVGERGLDAARKAASEAEGIAREHLLVALVYMGDKDALPEVRALVTDAADPVVRMDAARALGEARDKLAREALIQALQDDYLVHGADSLGEFDIYPVREQAAGALNKLGVKVSRQADGSMTAEE